MSTLVERDAVAKVQDLSDEFDNAKAFKFPFMSRVKKGSAPKNAKMTYAVEKYDDPKVTGAVDEADPEEFENPSEGDNELDVRVHVWERAVRIGGLATTVTHQSGITPKNVVAKKVAKKLIELKRDCEVTMLSDNESQVDNGVVGNETRGLVKWAQATAQSHYAVPTNFLTPSGSIDASTAVADYVDSTITAVAQSQYDETGDETEENVIFAGSTWQRGLDRITYSSKDESNRTVVRHFNDKVGPRVVMGKVQMLETSFGDIEVQLSQHVNASGDPTSAASKRLAVGGPLENMEIRWADAPNMIPLAKTGRSTKFLLTATGALCVKNPRKLMKFAPGS
jgi:hypothetical protein